MSDLVKALIDELKKQNLTLAIAESCTGGLVSSWITQISGASSIFERGFITYSNQSKIDMLGVSRNTLKKHGAVSQHTASAMALGALKNSRADIAISITGIAGPDGGSAEKPVGLVYFGIAHHNNDKPSVNILEHIFTGTRTDIQKQATEFILQSTLKEISIND